MRGFAVTVVLALAVVACSSDDAAAPSSATSASDGSSTTTSTTSAPSPSANCNGVDRSCAALVELGFSYPFPRLPDSYLFIDGGVYPYVEVTDDLLGSSVVELPDRSTMTAADLLDALGIEADASVKQPVIGYGSNASPRQLIRKFVDSPFDGHAVIPTMRGTLADYDVVFAPHFVAYGAMPATIVPAPGTDVTAWVNWLDPDELDHLNGSEGAGGLYAYGTLDGVELDVPGPEPESPTVYVDCFGALEIDGTILAVREAEATGRTSEPVSEAEALERVIPIMGFEGSPFDLLVENVTSTDDRTANTDLVAPLGRTIDDPDFTPQIGCAADPAEAGGGDF